MDISTETIYKGPIMVKFIYANFKYLQEIYINENGSINHLQSKEIKVDTKLKPSEALRMLSNSEITTAIDQFGHLNCFTLNGDVYEIGSLLNKGQNNE